jgi:uncharacterized protein YbcI
VVECLWVLRHVGFFISGLQFRQQLCQETKSMQEPVTTMAQQIADAATAFQQQRTGHAPKTVNVVLSENTLVITLHGALSAAEVALAKSPAGAAQVREFHRQLFANSCEPLRQEIKRITGVDVRESAAEVEPSSGTVVQVYSSGTMVQVFLLAQGVPEQLWKGNRLTDPL